MFYKLLGMAVFNGAKWFLRRRYGPTYVPVPVLAGVLVVLAGVIAAVVFGKRNGDSG